MHIQGDLQKVFDALHQLGVIDPVLKMNWSKERSDPSDYFDRLEQAMLVVNSCQQDFTKLLAELEKLDPRTLSFLAMEVAREYADFHSRNGLH